MKMVAGKMSRSLWLVSILSLAVILAILLGSQPAQALPEYAAQTGEPCATCHVSPSGGGPRTPRGQAWVAAGKVGSVPALTDALSLLGVHLEVDESQYVAAPESIPPAKPLQFKTGQPRAVYDWLKDYAGN
jgi:hypothetical protein